MYTQIYECIQLKFNCHHNDYLECGLTKDLGEGVFYH